MFRGPRPLDVNANPPQIQLLSDPVWRATFRGFFWGEGHMGIERVTLRRNGKTTIYHRPTYTISQANTNRHVLFHIRDVVGGTIYERKSAYNSKGAQDLPLWVWMLRSNELCERVTQMLVEEKFFPDKKAGKVRAMREFMDLVYANGCKKRSPETLDRMEELRLIVTPGGKKQ